MKKKPNSRARRKRARAEAFGRGGKGTAKEPGTTVHKPVRIYRGWSSAGQLAVLVDEVTGAPADAGPAMAAEPEPAREGLEETVGPIVVACRLDGVACRLDGDDQAEWAGRELKELEAHYGAKLRRTGRVDRHAAARWWRDTPVKVTEPEFPEDEAMSATAGSEVEPACQPDAA